MAGIREIVVISGKGGTGKTSIVGSFAELAKDAVFCDCDVDAANLGLLLKPEIKETVEFIVSKKAHIDLDLCTGCGECEEVCRFNAIFPAKGSPDKFEVDQLSCEGCNLCSRICPVEAIDMVDALSGHWYLSETEYGPLLHARLEPGEENSGRLVAAVREKAREVALQQKKSLVITDGPPGIGCPVIASLSGASVALVVTEPTLSGIHDLERVVQVCKHFDVPVMICINKWDIDPSNTESIKRKCEEGGHRVVGLVPYDDMVPKAIIQGKSVTQYDCPAGDSIKEMWNEIEKRDA